MPAAQIKSRVTVVDTYDYRDAAGQLVYQVLRKSDKSFPQRRPDGAGGWVWSLSGVDRVPYRLPELLAADPEAWVWVPEGEKDVETARRLGLVATCNSEGAGKWHAADTAALAKRKVALVPDQDSAGTMHRNTVAAALAGIAAELRVVNLPGAKDLTDWVNQGGTAPELEILLGLSSPPPAPPAMTPQRMEVALPEAPTEIFYGLGDHVATVLAPFVESDPVSILVQFLTAFGVAAGPQPHFMVGATAHKPLLYLGLIGRSSRSRKGTSWDPVERIFEWADNTGFKERVIPGVGSGERLVWLVRDPREKDLGASDRRLLLQEPELARLLTVANREGSTLSAYLRAAYDGRPIRNEVKTDGSVSTVHHIAMIGHCTPDELKTQLKEQQIRNGLGNRISWFVAKRTQRLPDPPDFGGRDVQDLVNVVADCLTRARNITRLRRSPAAQAVWNDWYSALPESEGAGVVAALTDRAEAHVVRMSAIYALTDHSATIEVWHLTAALALWDYSTACVRSIWAGSTGDLMADQVYDDLRFGDLYQSEISKDVFGGNVRADRMVEMRTLLESLGLIVIRYEHNGRPGRPSLRWHRLDQK